MKETVVAVEQPVQPGTTVLPGDEERIPPAFMPTSEMEPITAAEAKLVPVGSGHDMAQPTVPTEGDTAPAPTLESAEEIAKRVFTAPVEGDSKPIAAAVDDLPAGETEELANATSNVQDAPVVGAEMIKAPSVGAPSATVPSVAATSEEPSTTSKPQAPGSAHVVPTTVPAATTETTVSGPLSTKAPKEKDGGKVSSWLKTKFSRRASKASNPPSSSTHPTISEPRDPKVFVGGANLGAPDTTNTSSDIGDSSMREVAMAGKDAGPVDAPVVSPASVDDSHAAEALRERTSSSTSISSLSSDEDMRGRSAVRLADTINSPINQSSQPIFGTTTATHEDDRPPAVAGKKKERKEEEEDIPVGGEPIDPALPSHGEGNRQSSSLGGGTEDFEEARDEFDSEKLVPPDKAVIGGLEGRKSDSPARDSRFVEAL